MKTNRAAACSRSRARSARISWPQMVVASEAHGSASHVTRGTLRIVRHRIRLNSRRLLGIKQALTCAQRLPGWDMRLCVVFFLVLLGLPTAPALSSHPIRYEVDG